MLVIQWFDNKCGYESIPELFCMRLMDECSMPEFCKFETMKKATGMRKLFPAMILILLISAGLAGCKTGKGCDCPTFGKVEQLPEFRD